MPRIRYVAALTVALALALTGVASAKVYKVVGGTTKLTLSSTVVSVIKANKLTVKVLKPAKASGVTVTFPISGGRLASHTLTGYINHSGGLSVAKGKRALVLTEPQIVSTLGGDHLNAFAATQVTVCHKVGHKIVCHKVTRHVLIRVANLTGVKAVGTKITATVKLTGTAASALNAVIGKKVAKAGLVLGKATVSVKVK